MYDSSKVQVCEIVNYHLYGKVEGLHMLGLKQEEKGGWRKPTSLSIHYKI